jgi:hypothetical protein
MGQDSNRLISDISNVRFDLDSIDSKLYQYQMEQAAGEGVIFKLLIESATPEEKKRFEQALKQQYRIGLPHLAEPGDQRRIKELKEVLHDMAEDGPPYLPSAE